MCFATFSPSGVNCSRLRSSRSTRPSSISRRAISVTLGCDTCIARARFAWVGSMPASENQNSFSTYSSIASVNAMAAVYRARRSSESRRVPVLAGLAAAHEDVVLHERSPDRRRSVRGRGRAARGGPVARARPRAARAAARARASRRRPARSTRKRGASSAACGSSALAEQVLDDLQVTLRLEVAAHHAERPEQRAVAHEQAGDDRVERPLAGRDAVRVSRLEREATPRGSAARCPVPGATTPLPKP